MDITHQSIQFYLGDKLVALDFDKKNLSPTTTVLNYLRQIADKKGTKEGCAEGDCGACTVVIAEPDEYGSMHFTPVDSCLMFLPQLHGKQLISVEDISSGDFLHPVQKAIANRSGSQCGFCTPGIVMSLYGLYKSPEEKDPETVADYIAGNLCRCTGYKPILEAAEEALSIPEPEYLAEHEHRVAQALNLIRQRKQSIYIQTCGQFYYLALNLRDALAFLAENPESLVINGGTDVALRVTKKHETLSLILDISMVDELKEIHLTSHVLAIGSGVNLETVRQVSNGKFQALHEILNVFGSRQIRNRGTLGGNIGSASPIGDTLPVLMAYHATVVVQDLKDISRYPIIEFISGYRKTLLKQGQLITGIEIPPPEQGVIIKTYKISKRRDLDISTLSVAFRLILDAKNHIQEFQAFYGGMASQPLLAAKTSAFIKGKKFDRLTIEKAMDYISEDFSPIADARAEAESRLLFAQNILLKFWAETCGII